MGPDCERLHSFALVQTAEFQFSSCDVNEA